MTRDTSFKAHLLASTASVPEPQALVEQKLATHTDINRLLSRSISNVSLLAWEAKGEFPRRLMIGNRRAWVLKEVLEWIEAKAAERGDRS